MTLLAEQAQPVSLFGWNLGFTIGLLVVVAVVALVLPILVLAWRIGNQAAMINAALQRSYRNTAALATLRQTIDHAEVIVGGLKGARARLGGGGN
ncbi:hypothetical protein C3Y87_13635 [Carbonactinospora thermoautotrophica]|uniref:Uncharacterized protein n=1 Tax=Carbonactinospora thermoautotrophica TaxID=1469144 RepID=A0A132N643_9ACTN|nr:hypothetical protein [Carbonactinospora thermoautotrophica]KWX05476.1 hypothetical protein TH66_01945 [Carbonactinospora thermoautotrophica]KWX08040.1 hypothetical protein TR74_16665 [Carbonactinospora thermoautotrophica]MCX9192435.1 hypothetical protein [Carbonactinospora thermoautotrophica]